MFTTRPGPDASCAGRTHRLGRLAPVILASILVGCASAAAPSGSSRASEAPNPTGGSSATLLSPSALVAGSSAAACISGQTLGAGTVSVSHAQSGITAPLEVTMTDGWKGCGVSFKDLGSNGIMMVAFWTVGNVYRDPCRWKSGLYNPAVGPSVDDLVQALANQAITETTATAFSLDGFAGQHVHVSVADHAAVTGCDIDSEASFRLWDDANPARQGWRLFADSTPGLQGDAWILDVRGQRVVIQGAFLNGALPADQAEIPEIVRSVNFYP